MRRPSLRSQLNQIRLWVRQGRTDAWIAHKLDIPVAQLEQFKRNHELEGESSGSNAPLPVTAEPFAGEDDEEEEEELETQVVGADPEAEAFEFAGEEDADRASALSDPEVETDALEPEPDERESTGPSRTRRRGRRGGRRRASKRQPSYEATFEHGEEGYGLWLDPSVADDPVYAEHWAGHRSVAVSLDADAITIRRADPEEGD